MAWVKLDDSFPDHWKVVEAGEDAAWLYVAALCYANKHNTGGRVRASILPRLSRKGGAKLAARLVDVGLWERDGDDYLIHDYHDYQPTAEKRATVTEARREAGRSGGKASGAARRSKAEANAEANCFEEPKQAPKQNEPPTRPDPTRPDPTPERASLARDAREGVPAPAREAAPRAFSGADLDELWQEVTSKATGGSPCLIDAAKLIREQAAIERAPDVAGLARALVAANAEMLAEWRSRNEHHGSPDVEEFSRPRHFAKVVDWLAGRRPEAKPRGKQPQVKAAEGLF